MDGGTESPACAGFLCGVFGRWRRRRTLIIAAEVEPGATRRFATRRMGKRALIQTAFAAGCRGSGSGIRRAVAEEHDARVHTVVLLRAGRIPRPPAAGAAPCLPSQFPEGTLERLGEV